MRFINANFLTDEFTFQKGSFEVEDRKFKNIDTSGVYIGSTIGQNEIINLKGKKVIPGLIDIHIHGCAGVDFSTTDVDGIVEMCKYLGKSGITAFAGTSMTMPIEDLERCYGQAALFNRKRVAWEGAKLVGLYMEGPYLSEGKRGAQAKEYLCPPTLEQFKNLYQISERLLKIVCVAPELEGAMPFIEKALNFCRVSMGHTEADYEIASAAIKAGVTQVTHLYNGMNSIHHRAPAVPCAASESQNVRAELICDGVHVHPSAVRAAFKLFDRDRIILISDALSPCGMKGGEFTFGNNKVHVKDEVCVLEDGTLAGSATNLYHCVKKAISFGIEPGSAIKAATLNPAKSLGIERERGSISTNKYADFIICDDNYEILDVYIEGVKT